MERPYIIYHMTTTMDGKINGSFLDLESVQPVNEFYYQCHRQFKTDAFLCGRVTMQESFTGDALPDLSAWEGQNFPREDHVANSNAAFYAVALDPKGKLNWLSDHITDEDTEIGSRVTRSIIDNFLRRPSLEDYALTAIATMASNDDRVRFLTELGWQVSTSPTESSQVRIPKDSSEVFDRYNALQISQGYDLTPYMGKNVMRYVYKVENYPNTTEPVYATLLIHKNQIIGGDITDTAAKGLIQGLKKATATVPPTSSPDASHS